MATEDAKLKTLYEVRRKNLRATLEASGWGAKKQLADQMQWANASRVSQMLNPKSPTNPKWQITEKMAREIEKVKGLPWGWLDHIHESTDPYAVAAISKPRGEVHELPLRAKSSEPPPRPKVEPVAPDPAAQSEGSPPPLDPKKLEQVLTAIASTAERLQLPLPPSELAQITSFVYAYSPEAGGVSEDLVQHLLSILKRS